MDEQLVRTRVEARKLANELTDYITSESSKLNTKLGLDASCTFLDTIRDNLIALRPLPIPPLWTPEKPGHIKQYEKPARGWDNVILPEEYRLITINAECTWETEKAVMIGGKWFPKSVMLEIPETGDYIDEWPVADWWATKEGY